MNDDSPHNHEDRSRKKEEKRVSPIPVNGLPLSAPRYGSEWQVKPTVSPRGHW